MSDEDIDLDRVVVDPHYRREVIDYLKKEASDQHESSVMISEAS
jgi:hypothetical protein